MNTRVCYLLESYFNKYCKKHICYINRKNYIVVFLNSLRNNNVPVILTENQLKIELHKLNIDIRGKVVGFCDLTDYIKTVKGKKEYYDIYNGMLTFLSNGGIIKIDKDIYDKSLIDYFKINES